GCPRPQGCSADRPRRSPAASWVPELVTVRPLKRILHRRPSYLTLRHADTGGAQATGFFSVEQLTRHSDLRDLEREVAPMADNLGADLDQLSRKLLRASFEIRVGGMC